MPHLIAQLITNDRAPKVLLGLTNHLPGHLNGVLLSQRKTDNEPDGVD